MSRFEKARFTLSPDGFGGWEVQGAMTPSMDMRQCKPNPAAGVSSIPLSTLPGSPAAATEVSANAVAGQAPTAVASEGAGSIATGSYECWANGQARMLMNFTVRSATQYTGSDGKPGTYTYDPGSGRVMFRGGALDGVMPAGFSAIYHAPGGKPTVSFRSGRGAEAAFCERVR